MPAASAAADEDQWLPDALWPAMPAIRVIATRSETLAGSNLAGGPEYVIGQFCQISPDRGTLLVTLRIVDPSLSERLGLKWPLP